MFERYTEKARRVIFFARMEASKTGSHFMEPEHLLLGLLHEAKPLFEGVNINEMAQELRAAIHIEGAPEIDTALDLPLSQSGKHVLVCSLQEADQLHDSHVGPEHMLFALTRESGFAAKILQKHQIDRNRLIGLLRPNISVPIDMHSKSMDIVLELEHAFAPLAKRLTPEIEPAVVYVPPQESAS